MSFLRDNVILWFGFVNVKDTLFGYHRSFYLLDLVLYLNSLEFFCLIY